MHCCYLLTPQKRASDPSYRWYTPHANCHRCLLPQKETTTMTENKCFIRLTKGIKRMANMESPLRDQLVQSQKVHLLEVSRLQKWCTVQPNQHATPLQTWTLSSLFSSCFLCVRVCASTFTRVHINMEVREQLADCSFLPTTPCGPGKELNHPAWRLYLPSILTDPQFLF